MFSMLIRIRDTIGLIFRFLPARLKGRAFIGRSVTKIINIYCGVSKKSNFIRLIKMKDGTLFSMDLRDITTIEPFYTGKYEYVIFDFIKEKLKSIKAPLVLDVGAHIGFLSIPIARLIAPNKGVVHAFEPIEANRNYLDKNRQLNNLHNLDSHPYGLGDEETYTTINLPENTETHNVALIVDGENRNFKVKIRKLDNVCNERNLSRCSFIKLDVEGFEIKVIKGGINFIKKYKPIIFGEFSKVWLERNNNSVQEAYRLLKPLGYKTLRITRDCKVIRFDDEQACEENVIFMAK